MERSSSRPQRRRSLKARRTYREPDSETDLDFESTSSKRRPTRSNRHSQTYRELTTSEDEPPSTSIESATDSDPSLAPILNSRRSLSRRARSGRIGGVTRRSQRNTEVKKGVNLPGAMLNSFKKQKTNHHTSTDLKSRKDAWLDEVSLPFNLHAPPWQTLEYRILVKIMQHASYPLYSGTFKSRSSIGWLVGMSKLCRSFHEAAMTALLWEPPLFPFIRAHGLIDVLSRNPEQCMVNYRTKVRSLNIEVRQLVKKCGIKIENLVKFTPLLSHLRIFHSYDDLVGKVIWADANMSHFRWSYEDLFDHLDNNGIRLKSFEWNGRFQDTLHAMSAAHERLCMAGLEEISIVNFCFTEKQLDECIKARDEVTSALSPLSNLRRVQFRNCTFLDLQATIRLPLGLTSLKIVNSLSLTSEGMSAFLSRSGHDIRELHLEGNQVMDLGFMPKLLETCPKLETLYIDLSYEDCSSYHDRNPLYDELLPNGSPTWPTTLVSVVVGPLRSLNVTDAQEFYTSLINAANHLPYLRILRIKTILNDANWRDRAGLRAKWRSVFEKVFANNKTYMPAMTRQKQEKVKGSQRKSARLQVMEDMSISEDGENGDDTLSDGAPLPRQNRCEIVEFDLSDQRPAQEQFREADFLDSEPSGDGEWNG